MNKTINGAVFRRMLVQGAKLVELNRQKIDALNVFPVPDGDTGTNMSLTLQSALREINNVKNNNFQEVADAFATGALKGARGNSGVILSQIIRGICSIVGMAEDNTLDMKTYVNALKRGVEIAYKAVAKPQEGTILTVVRVSVENLIKDYKKCADMKEFQELLIAHANDILNKTPDMLPVLKKAGVVDAGGKGLIYLFEGMLKGYLGEEIDLPDSDEVEEVDELDLLEHADITDLADIEFAYCTEFFIINLYKKTTLTDIDKLKERLMALGDSVVVVGDLSFVKVHVHTNNPGKALQFALELGELDKLKIENMLEQNRALLKKLEESKKDIGMLAVCAGEGFASLFKDLRVDQVIEGGQTMNPSADDIAKAAKKVNADNVFVFPNNKNIILAAEQAKALVTNKNIHVVPTKTVPEGLAAALSFDEEVSVEENKVNMLDSISQVTTGSITYAVRKTNLDGFDLNEGDIMGLGAKSLLAVGQDVAKVASDLVDKLKDKGDVVTLYYGQDVKEEEAEKLVEELSEKYQDLDIQALCGGQPIYYYVIAVE